MGSRSSPSWEEGGGGLGGPAEPDLSWMTFSPEAHGLKPALSVWPSRSNEENNYNNSFPDNQQQEHEEHEEHEEQQLQKKKKKKKKKKRFGIGLGLGIGSGRRSEGRSGIDENEYEWTEDEIVEEYYYEEERLGKSRRRRGKEQPRKIREDFDYNDFDDGFDEDGGLSSSRQSAGIRRTPLPSFPPSVQGHRPQQKKSWLERLEDDDVAALQQQLPWSTSYPRTLQFAAVVASFGCLVALAISIVLLYLSFGVTAQPPSSCEVENVVLNFTVQRIRLRGGRYISFREQGVGADRAHHSLLIVHDLLSSRLAGIPGISESLLQEFGVRLIAYDRPGYGQSDRHFGRSYNSSAQDMADIADALGLGDKFWVAGFGNGGPHVWAAIKYIPERLAGVALFAPAGNFYAENMTKDEVSDTWGVLTLRQKWMYSMARLFPALLPSFLQKALIDHNPNPFRIISGPTVGSKDQVLMEKEEILDFWELDLREALLQQCAFPVAEELILLVDWGFSLAKLPFSGIEVQTLLQQFVGLFQVKEKPRIFSGPIHVWQGSDDQHVPATFSEYAKRMIELNDFSEKPDYQVNLHILEGEGHFSWFWFCDECHRSIFDSLFERGAVSGPFGRQVFSVEEYEAILAAFGGSKERVDKTEEAPDTSPKNEYEAIFRNFGGPQERVNKLTKSKEAPITSAKNKEYEAIRRAFEESQERVDKLTRSKAYSVTSPKNTEYEATRRAFEDSQERVDKLTRSKAYSVTSPKNTEYEATRRAFEDSQERVDKLTRSKAYSVTSPKNIEYESTRRAFDGPQERVDKLTKTEKAPVNFANNCEGATDELSYRDKDSEEAASTGIKLFVPESCDVPIDISAFIIKAIDERIKKYFK